MSYRRNKDKEDKEEKRGEKERKMGEGEKERKMGENEKLTQINRYKTKDKEITIKK
jgi:hypothetical protein